MKGGSSLNPYAKPYVPLSVRETTDANKESTSRGHELRTVNEGVSRRPNLWEQSVLAAQGNKSYGVDIASHMAENTEIYDFHGYRGSSSYNPGVMIDKDFSDVDFDMHMTFLQGTFPNVKYDYLAEVFVEHNCDVDATVEALNRLEVYAGESSPKLPETLDFWDVPDSGLSAEAPAVNSNANIEEVGGPSSEVFSSAPANVKLGK